MAGLLIDDAAHFLERIGEIAGDARHHGVGVAARHHGGGEMVAVLIDEALAVAEQKALALQPLEQELRIDAVALRQLRIVNLDAGNELHAGVGGVGPSPDPSRPTSTASPNS
jgi:hypothetical protein